MEITIIAKKLVYLLKIVRETSDSITVEKKPKTCPSVGHLKSDLWYFRARPASLMAVQVSEHWNKYP